ncbi:uncharacterized protein LOC129310637 [Prosopis cineraria]|uniref:uncharacterized protein LOC129310637 n=1 Tax=Prosopis cineraria TaxID=364024 RepID=UPI00240F473F|nr:uncharacterized protein LOC129310637 [Prosopis cineraria]
MRAESCSWVSESVAALESLNAVMALSQENQELLHLLNWWLVMAKAVHEFFFFECLTMILKRCQVSHVSCMMDCSLGTNSPQRAVYLRQPILPKKGRDRAVIVMT